MISARQNSDIAQCEAADTRRNPPLPSPLRALAVQLVAGGVAVIAAFAWALPDFPAPPPIVWALLQGALAAALAQSLAMERWWLWIHLLFLPALVLASATGLPPWSFLCGFLLLFLVHGATYRTQVPTHLSRRKAVAAAVKLLPPGPGFRCIDLGCGFGGVLDALARLRRDGEYRGIEGALLPFAASWIRGRFNGCRVRWGDLWDVDLGVYDVVYVYLSPAAMPRLWAKARNEMRPGSILISNNFLIPGVAPALTVDIDPRRGAAVYLWRIGESRC